MSRPRHNGRVADDAALDAIAAELCALPPEKFTAARNARASAASPPALAKAVKALRKPVVAAWAVNALAQDGGLTDALALAAELREAQDDLDAPELARLSKQRRALVAGLARQAVTLGRDRGVTVSGAARDDVEKTINAAVMDAAAAAAVSTGRLVRPLEASGFDAVDVSDAVNGSLAGVAAAPPPSRDDLAERRARKAAAQALREAERAENEAERALARTEERLVKARERADLLHERVDDLRRELERISGDAADADAAVARLDAERKDAASAATTAARAAAAARAASDA